MSASAGDGIMTPVPEATDTTTEPLSPSPSSGDSSSVTRTTTLPMSPPRPQQPQQPQTPTPSVPSSPANSLQPADRSPAMTPTPQQNPFAPAETTGVVLGLEQLERQQDEAERRRKREQIQQTTPQQPPPPQHVHSSPVTLRYLDDDTAPSSTLESQTRASHTGDGSLGSGDDGSLQNVKEGTKFGRMSYKSIRKRLSSNDFLRRRSSDNMDDPAEDEEEGPLDALIYGHLQKLGRNGKWQTRWFESDGECLSYYKTSKRSKLLATLDLEKVGAIVVNEDDPKGCSFTIAVLGRPYYLRAESRAACKDWVITLNRVKEAKLQQGNVKLVHQKHILFRSPPDLLSTSSSAFAQGIAIENPHRPRTRALDGSTIDNIEDMMKEPVNDPAGMVPAAYYHQTTDDTESLSQVVLARWQKRKTSMSRLASKLSRWARSVKKYRCSDAESDVRLDRHVHPPGHDNVAGTNPAKQIPEREEVPPPQDPALTGWIGKEASLAVKAGPVVIDPDEALEALDVIEPTPSDPVTHSGSSGGSSIAPEEEGVELEPRELS